MALQMWAYLTSVPGLVPLALAVGSISEVGDIHVLGWKEPDLEVLEKLDEAGVRPQGLAVTDYTIDVERVLLDDGKTSPMVSLRLLGIHSHRRPQVGERFLFSLRVDDELRICGVCLGNLSTDLSKGLAQTPRL